MNLTTTIPLNNGVAIPQLGLGVYRSPNGMETFETVRYALETGYRHVDTARIYHNEADVGAALRAAGVPREQVFVTTKLWESDQGYDSAIAAYHESLRLMGLEYVDLFLIHWPLPGKRRYSWMALETLLEEGRVRAIGVSNYVVRHLAAKPVDEALVSAPVLVFNGKDALQARFLSLCSDYPLEPPVHFIPSVHGFIEAARRGLGWGMVPAIQCRRRESRPR